MGVASSNGFISGIQILKSNFQKLHAEGSPSYLPGVKSTFGSMANRNLTGSATMFGGTASWSPPFIIPANLNVNQYCGIVRGLRRTYVYARHQQALVLFRSLLR